MADDQLPPDNELSSPTDTASDNEKDWGDDWESAFQAEDDMFFSEEESEDDFFLDDEDTQGTQGSAKYTATALEQNLAGLPDQNTGTGIKGGATPSITATVTTLIILLKAATLKPLHLLQALPLYFRFPAYGLLGLLGLGIIFLTTRPDTPENDLAKLQATAELTQQTSTAAPTQSQQIDESLPLKQAITEQTRKKWPFSPFFIPVRSQQKDQALTFVLVDITLVTVMDEKDELPTDKKPFVRDIIYQFYKNRPLEELHRFSLARGEMNRKLKAWLQKQWPDGPVESIIFTRYRLT